MHGVPGMRSVVPVSRPALQRGERTHREVRRVPRPRRRRFGPDMRRGVSPAGLGFGIYDDLVDHPLAVERVALMPDPVITQPNYAIEPCEAALRAVGPDTLRNLGEI